MNFVQAFLVIFGIFVYATVALNPPAKKVEENSKEIKPAEKNNADSEHVAPNKSGFIANVPPPKSSTKQNIGSNTTLPNKTNSQAVINNVTPNQTGSTSHDNLPKINQTLEEKSDELSSGAITRGILVFVALGFLFILYVGLKTYRGKKQDKRRTIVKKYGVRARRSDVEMEPLPLSDDEDDETVFDLTASRGNSI